MIKSIKSKIKNKLLKIMTGYDFHNIDFKLMELNKKIMSSNNVYSLSDFDKDNKEQVK